MFGAVMSRLSNTERKVLHGATQIRRKDSRRLEYKSRKNVGQNFPMQLCTSKTESRVLVAKAVVDRCDRCPLVNQRILAKQHNIEITTIR